MAEEEVKEVEAEVVTVYTMEDYISGDKPYAELYAEKDPFKRKQKLIQMADDASKIGFKQFRSMFKSYVDMQKRNRQENADISNVTMLTSPYMELDAGKYTVDDDGISLFNDFDGMKTICHQPIIPFEILRNIDTGEEKVNLAYRSRGIWHEIIVSKEVLYNARNITQLVKCGVDISSETAKDMVSYFQEIEAINRDILPLKKSVGRLGFIKDEGFSPYVDGITFDGDQNYGRMFNAVHSEGDFQTWIDIAAECRQKSVTAKIFLAASFAAALIEPLGGLPFFVHLWGVDSGTGKTVALMLAASVWGNPEIGEYIQTFNSTEVGHEKTAAFLNNLPFLIDELQLSKDSHGRSRFDVYKLAQGVGRTRGTKTGGIEKTPTWRNTILTTGESPIVHGSAGAGAVNRVIDIECSADHAVISDGMRVSGIVKKNYGWAGKMFARRLTEPAILNAAMEIYNDYFKELCEGDTTEKQAMAAAMILTADLMITPLFFDGDEPLTVKEISQFLKSKESVSAGERGYQYICDWVAANSKRFSYGEENTGEVYGTIVDDVAYIIRSKFSDAMQKQGFDERAVLSWLKVKNLIIIRGRRFTRGKRINGINVECVALKLPEIEPEFYSQEELNTAINEDIPDLL